MGASLGVGSYSHDDDYEGAWGSDSKRLNGSRNEEEAIVGRFHQRRHCCCFVWRRSSSWKEQHSNSSLLLRSCCVWLYRGVASRRVVGRLVLVVFALRCVLALSGKFVREEDEFNNVPFPVRATKIISIDRLV
jgi:hypothetical protein